MTFGTYRIFKDSRPAGNKWFSTYEAARQHLRKRIRKLTTDRSKGQPTLPMWTFGYEIRRV